MPQNGKVSVLKCSAIWKTMRKSFKASELKFKFVPKLGNRKLWLTIFALKFVH